MIVNISRQTALSQALPPNQPRTASVTAQNNQNLNILLNGSHYSINSQTDLKAGQLISLIYRPSKSQIEIRPVNTEQILKSALARLLPQAMKSGAGNSLVSLTNMMQSLIPKPPSATVSGGTATPITPLLGQAGTQPQIITQFLSLLQSIPKISTLDRTVIQQWAEFFSIENVDPGKSSTRPENPFNLLKQLPTNEAGLRPLLQQWAKQISATTKMPAQTGSNGESLDNDAFSGIAKEILKLVDQSLYQLQYQQANLRYQQELQQPVNLSLTIPLTEEQTTQPLQLRIRERKSSANDEESAWDIDLSFEFGSLGLISSHINLVDNIISTTFWSSQEDTKLMIDHALPDFKQQLLKSGFETGRFFSLEGPAPIIVEQEFPFHSDNLLDITV